MIMMKPGRLVATALFGAAVGFFQPASAITITLTATTATVDCVGPSDPACLGFVGGGSSGFPSFAGTLSSTSADLYAVKSKPADELLAIQILANDGTISGAVKLDAGGGDTFEFFTDAAYFLIKIGGGSLLSDHAFFQLFHSGIVTVNYDKQGQTAGGISHISTFGGTVTEIPLPAALPIFLLMLGGTALVARRRRGVAGAA